jgi:hypothetical protein
MPKLHGLCLAAVATAGCLVLAAAAQPKAEKPGHSGFYRDFSAEGMVTFSRDQFKFVKDKCGSGSRGFGRKWEGEEVEEDFKIFDLTGDLSEDEVKQVLGALQAELVKRVRAGKAALGHDPKDTIVDRPMRLLQPGFIWADAAVLPSSLRGFYFPYKDGKVEGWVDVLAVRMVRDKKTEWLILGGVHEVAR